MAQESTTSPLALTAGAGLYNNTGLAVNVAMTTNKTTYENLSPIANLLFTIEQANSNVALAITASTFAALQSIGGNVDGAFLPALGDSAPSNIGLTTGTIGNVTAPGLTGRMLANANVSIGNGSISKFAQAFSAAQGYISITNQIIESALNANEYLGPTFDGQENLITADIGKLTTAYSAFGRDLAKLGNLLPLQDLDLFGTPAGLLKQLAESGNMVNGSTPAIESALRAQGLTNQNIADLVQDNRCITSRLFRVSSPTNVCLTQNDFDKLQKAAYPALCTIQGQDLTDALTILGVTTDNISTLCDLLDPKKIFPESYPSLTLWTPSGPVLIYNNDGEVDSLVEEILNNGSVTPKGCDDLSKIIPSDQAVSNRALQVSFAQIKGITDISLQQLAQVLT